jgi:ankyrin repeat protein
MGKTFQWVLKRAEFEEWAQGKEHTILLITGKPGCGKSVLLANLRRNVDGPVAYFACKAAARRTPEMILSSLLRQILIAQPHLFRHVLPRDPLSQTWTYGQLLDSFNMVLNSPNNNGITCMVDAIDECWVDTRRQLLRDLRRIFDRVSRHDSAGYARLILTSRKYADLVIPGAIELDLDSSPEMGTDLSEFIQHKVTLLTESRPEYRPLSPFITQKLEAKANGMYKLVELLIDDLEITADSSRASLERALDSVPPDIGGAYDKIWDRIPFETRPRAQRIFSWLLCLLEPLTPQGLAIAIATEFISPEEEAQVNPTNITQDVRGDLQRLFGPLIHIGPTIELSHQTVKDHFLPNSKSSSNRSALLVIDQCRAHASIGLACLRYLNSCDFITQTKRSYQPNDFLSYALRFMAQHLALSSPSDCYFTDQLLTFFKRGLWQEDWSQRSKFGSESLTYSSWKPSINNALSFCCQYDLPRLLIRLMEPPSIPKWVCSEEGWSAYACCSLLHEAFLGASEECVKIIMLSLDNMMFEHPINCSHLLVDCSVRQPLEAKLEELESGMKHMKQSSMPVDALCKRSNISQDLVLKVLTEVSRRQLKGQMIRRSENNTSRLDEKVQGAYRTLCPYSIANPDRELLSIIHEDSLYNTVLFFCLYIAWTYGKASIDVLGPQSPALLQAVKRGQHLAVRLLIQEGAGINIQDAEGTTVLHWAAKTGNPELVDLLLSQNCIDVNSRSEDGLTPLHFACSKHSLWDDGLLLAARPRWVSRSHVVRLLLKSGADIRAKSDKGNTPFQTLARVYVPEWKKVPKDSELNWRERDLNACVESLLQDVSDVIEWDSFGATPLHYATYLWPLSAIKQLLQCLDDYCLGPTLLDHKGLTPLHYAAVRSFDEPQEVIQMLSEAGVDARIQDLFSDTPLSTARAYGKKQAVDELLRIEQKLEEKEQLDREQRLYNRWLPHTNSSSGSEIFKELPIANQGSISQLALRKFETLNKLSSGPYSDYPSTEVNHLYPIYVSAPLTTISQLLYRIRQGKLVYNNLQIRLPDGTINFRQCWIGPKSYMESMQFRFADIARNLDPFASIGLSPIYRPIPPAEFKDLLTLSSANTAEGLALLIEKCRSSPLQAKYPTIIPDSPNSDKNLVAEDDDILPISRQGSYRRKNIKRTKRKPKHGTRRIFYWSLGPVEFHFLWRDWDIFQFKMGVITMLCIIIAYSSYMSIDLEGREHWDPNALNFYRRRPGAEKPRWPILDHI